MFCPYCFVFFVGLQREEINVELWVPLSHTSAGPFHLLFWANWISAWVSAVFIKLMLCCLHTAHAAIKKTPFWVLNLHTQTHTHTSSLLDKSFVSVIQKFFLTRPLTIFFLHHCRALSSSSRRVTSTWLSTTSRCCTMASWPAPSPSPTTPRRRTPSSAWSRRPEKTPPSSSTRRTHSCYRSVWLDSAHHWTSESLPHLFICSAIHVWMIDLKEKSSSVWLSG